MENYDVNNPNCLAHQDALARIEEQLGAINKGFERLNGSVARHEGEIVAINLRAAREDGRRGGVNMIAVWAVTMLGVIFAGWQAASAQRQTSAALERIQSVQQIQGNR